MSDETATLDVPSDTDKTEVDRVVIRMAGDSGDGMQLAGSRFTDASAVFGNDLATLPSFPAEIRAPAGTLPGVSSFQIRIAHDDILTAGDNPDCLVAMNPAALKKHLPDLRKGGTVILNEEAFVERNLSKAGYDANPLEDDTLAGFKVIKVPMESLTKEAVKDTGVSGRDVLRSKNFFALGLLSWLFNRPTDPTIEWVNANDSGGGVKSVDAASGTVVTGDGNKHQAAVTIGEFALFPGGGQGPQLPSDVIDVFDALTSDRPYRDAWSQERTLEYIQESADVLFDPKVVDEFIAMMTEAPSEEPEIIYQSRPRDTVVEVDIDSEEAAVFPFSD